jgi:transposase-like protein
MTQKPRRIFTGEQKAEAVRISAAPAGHVTQFGKAVSQGAREKDLWGRQSLLGEEAGGKGRSYLAV